MAKNRQNLIRLFLCMWDIGYDYLLNKLILKDLFTYLYLHFDVYITVKTNIKLKFEVMSPKWSSAIGIILL